MDELERTRRERDEARADVLRLCEGSALEFLAERWGQDFVKRLTSYRAEKRTKQRPPSSERLRCDACGGTGVMQGPNHGQLWEETCSPCGGRGSLNADGSRW
jgi:DnaJ-class molecular chaperone